MDILFKLGLIEYLETVFLKYSLRSYFCVWFYQVLVMNSFFSKPILKLPLNN